MYQPKIEKDIWCPFEYGFDVFRREMEAEDYMCSG